jgi:hypothetical protein
MVFYDLKSLTTILFSGALVEKSNFWGMAREEDKLYEEFGSYEHGMSLLCSSFLISTCQFCLFNICNRMNLSYVETGVLVS